MQVPALCGLVKRVDQQRGGTVKPVLRIWAAGPGPGQTTTGGAPDGCTGVRASGGGGLAQGSPSCPNRVCVGVVDHQ